MDSEPVPYVRTLSALADEHADRIAITCGSSTITRRQLESGANRLARSYVALGVGVGDFVTIGLPNGIEFFSAVIACWKVGAVPQPISPRMPLLERQAIVELADAALVLGADPADHPSRSCLPGNFVPDASFDDGPLPEVVSPAWKAPTSGGSTGRPKLIVSGGGAAGDPSALGGLARMRSSETQLVPGPLYHNAPLTNALTGLMLNHHLVVLPRFDAREALQAISDYAVSFVQVVPTMMLRMLRVLEEEPGAYDISSLRVLWHMASPCPEWLKQAWIDRIGAAKVMELYGGTELQAITVISGDEWLEHRGSVGRPAFGQMMIQDTVGKPAPVGEVGEIFMRRDAGARPTYTYIGAEARQRDGWESLGDLGWMDQDGYVYISDRRADLILSGGANVYPAEVEAAIDAHPKVLSSVVVGLPDDDLGQRVHAFVQVSSQAQVSAVEIIEHVATRLVRYKVPRSVEFIDEPLRDDAGKVRRSAMRDEATARLDSRR
jgi:bile acid-coenzyme A ligase